MCQKIDKTALHIIRNASGFRDCLRKKRNCNTELQILKSRDGICYEADGSLNSDYFKWRICNFAKFGKYDGMWYDARETFSST